MNTAAIERERLDQIEAGRQLASNEGETVVHRKKTFINDRTSKHHAPDTESGSANRGSPTKAFTAKGHDAVLKACQDRKSDVKIKEINGSEVTGVIVARDRYTISLQVHGETDPRLYYKAQIVFFQPKRPVKVAE